MLSGLRSLLIPDVGKLSNSLLCRSIDILSPEVNQTANPTADAAVDPAADLVDQVRWRRWRTFSCEGGRVVHRLLDILQSAASSKASHNRTEMRTNLKLATWGRATVQGLQGDRGAKREMQCSLATRILQTPSTPVLYITMKASFSTPAHSPFSDDVVVEPSSSLSRRS